MSRRLVWSTLALPLFAGCTGGVLLVSEDDTPVARPKVCGGSLGPVPKRIASDLKADWLYAFESSAFVGERETDRIQQVDLCTGEVRVVAAFEGLSDLAQDGPMLIATGTKDGVVGAFRYDTRSGELTLLSELRRSGQVAAAEGRVFVLLVQDAVNPESPYGEPSLDLLEVLPSGPVLINVIEAWAPATTTTLVGASQAGVYITQSYDCGCNPALTLYPADGSAKQGIKDSAGSRSIAVQGERMFLAADLDPNGFGESVVDIVSMPIAGGDTEVLLAADEALTYDVIQIASDERSVCFKPYARAPRCIDQASGALRSLSDEATKNTGSLIAMGGGVVWWGDATESATDLWAAVP